MSEIEISPILSSVATPEYRRAQRWNIVWFVPVLALLTGSWMVYRNFTLQGPIAQVRFDTADGIGAGKTEVRCRSVRVGMVKDVKLADDLNSVIILIELNTDYKGLLRAGTNFWVVKPRISTTDVSGLGTLITGAYIELSPGLSKGIAVHHYNGLETPPATNRNIPGRRLILVADEAGSLNVGSPIFCRGFEVGRIENRTLDIEGQRVTYDAFIQEKFSSLVKKSTRFWNTSGIQISAGANGVKVRTPSFEAMLAGGATFGGREGAEPSEEALDGTVFTLFANEDAANDSNFNPSMKFVLLFDQSVRGLVKSAPVEFRGIPIGRVADISFDYLKDSRDFRVPVLVDIDTSLLRHHVADEIRSSDHEYLRNEIQRGLRASLKVGSILTGALFVDLDYYKNQPPVEFAVVGDHPSIPTISTGFAQLETKFSAILDKIQGLPLDETMKKFGVAADEAAITVAESRKALLEIQEAVIAARKMMDASEFANLPKDLKNTLVALEKSVTSVGPDGAIQGDLLRTLDELRSALRAMSSMVTTIDEKPNSIIFGRDSSGNSIPRAPKGKH